MAKKVTWIEAADFQGDVAVQSEISCAIHFAHAPGPDRRTPLRDLDGQRHQVLSDSIPSEVPTADGVRVGNTLRYLFGTTQPGPGYVVLPTVPPFEYSGCTQNPPFVI